tara:strand:- start:209 stop:340 length:132 start_codon:yes stop_codon:yes gene_type:complete
MNGSKEQYQEQIEREQSELDRDLSDQLYLEWIQEQERPTISNK